MIKSYDPASKDAMLAHLELLTIKAISYLWVSVHAFHKFIAKQVKQHRLDWPDYKSIQDQATFFHHSDLRTMLRQHNKIPRSSSNSTSSGNNQQAVTNSVPRLVEPGIILVLANVTSKTLMLTRNIIYAVCKADHPILHCSKRRTPIP